MTSKELSSVLTTSSATGNGTTASAVPSLSGGVMPTDWLKDIASGDPHRVAEFGIVRRPGELSYDTHSAAMVMFNPNNPYYYNNPSYSNPLLAHSRESINTTPAQRNNRLLMTTKDSGSNKYSGGFATSSAFGKDSAASSDKLSQSLDSNNSHGIPANKRAKLDYNNGSYGRQGADNSNVNSIPHRPEYFHKGSVIQLGNVKLKRIEDMQTSDFETSALHNSHLSLDCSTVIYIREDESRGTAHLTFRVGDGQHDQISATVEATVEHPFFVFDQGWSSVRPDRTLSYYNLPCSKLQVDDRCISLTINDLSLASSKNSQTEARQTTRE